MKKQGKKILKGSLVITIIVGVIILLTVGGMYLISESKEVTSVATEVFEESQDPKEETQNEEIVVDISEKEIETEVENTPEENISTNEEIPVVQEKAKEEIKANTKSASVVNKDKKDVTVNKNKQETPKQEKVEPPTVTTTTSTAPTNPVKKEDTNKSPAVEPPKVKEEPKKDVHTYKYNATITEKIKQDIKNNESTYMKQYGYTIVIDESIVTQTNQFTYTNNRVKNMIINKFGTIRIYARDYYLNGNYMYTEAYII